MLRTCQQAQRIAQVVTLVSTHCRFAECSCKLRIFAKTFVSSAPTFIARDSDTRSESPVDTGRSCFDRSDACGAFDQLWIARAAKTDVVRKESCAENVAVSVNCVDAVENRDAQARVLRTRLQAVVMIGPVDQTVTSLRIGLPP